MAVWLPKSFGFKPGDAVEMKHENGKVEISAVLQTLAGRTKVLELVRRLNELGPVKSPQARKPIEFPDRAGLY